MDEMRCILYAHGGVLSSLKFEAYDDNSQGVTILGALIRKG